MSQFSIIIGINDKLSQSVLSRLCCRRVYQITGIHVHNNHFNQID